MPIQAVQSAPLTASASAQKKLAILMGSKMSGVTNTRKGRKYGFFLHKPESSKYNEIYDRNMSKDANDKHKNMLLNIAEMVTMNSHLFLHNGNAQ